MRGHAYNRCIYIVSYNSSGRTKFDRDECEMRTEWVFDCIIEMNATNNVADDDDDDDHADVPNVIALQKDYVIL